MAQMIIDSNYQPFIPGKVYVARPSNSGYFLCLPSSAKDQIKFREVWRVDQSFKLLYYQYPVEPDDLKKYSRTYYAKIINRTPRGDYAEISRYRQIFAPTTKTFTLLFDSRDYTNIHFVDYNGTGLQDVLPMVSPKLAWYENLDSYSLHNGKHYTGILVEPYNPRKTELRKDIISGWGVKHNGNYIYGYPFKFTSRKKAMDFASDYFINHYR